MEEQRRETGQGVTDPSRRQFRPEIQALRALAVAAVVVYHVWPRGPLPGGFIGVDVFFVISGFLITGHLLRDIHQPLGRYLAGFWSRRAIRILPASFVMIAVVGLVGAVVLPNLLAPSHWSHLVASTLYVENVHLIRSASDYLSSHAGATAFQHAWSLSVEEQFYLVWPLIVLVLIGRARRTSGAVRRRRAVLALGLTALALVSALWSVIDTAQNPARAYYSTFTRVHEFAVGAILAVVLSVVPVSAIAARVARWGGLVVVLASAVLISEKSAFPGHLALVPCAGAAAIIWAGGHGAERGRDPLWRIFTSRPVQWVGDASYSIYLWHWPVIVLLPFIRLGPLAGQPQLLAVALTLVLAMMSRRFIELPTQHWLRRRRPRDVGLFTLMAMVVVLVIGVGGLHETRPREGGGAKPRTGACIGAEAAVPANDCDDVFTARPGFQVGKGDSYAAQWDRECAPRYPKCWPEDAAPSSKVVALVGDSHAKALYPALAKAAADRGWSVITVIRDGCPPNLASFRTRPNAPTSSAQCVDFSERATQVFQEVQPALIVTTATTSEVEYASLDAAVAGFSSLWKTWMEVAPVVVVRDHPLPRTQAPQECIAPRTAQIQERCAVPRDTAAPPNLPMTVAGNQLASERLQFVDLTDVYCDEQRCHPVVGGVPVYYDRDHINGAFSATLAKPLGDAIRWNAG